MAAGDASTTPVRCCDMVEECTIVGVLAWRSGGERGCIVVLKMVVG
ncbi:hypothetical protein F383_14391 [Gossypium arboreum]|uniref:Uncharacterized protein n=1 Tax=Gossypium arboreum TaxID=29729 RepID=A0A0B0MUU1_GOSAR|nr:hypothetical protein F383_30143 [Gossypium arboreum]KHG11157.1 hypothetical protein F383_14391 [Gossypium arboreum]